MSDLPSLPDILISLFGLLAALYLSWLFFTGTSYEKIARLLFALNAAGFLAVLLLAIFLGARHGTN